MNFGLHLRVQKAYNKPLKTNVLEKNIMFKRTGKTGFRPHDCLLAAVFAAATILAGCEKKAPEPTSNETPTEQNVQAQTNGQTAENTGLVEPPEPTPDEPKVQKSPTVEPPKPGKNLIDVIRARLDWGPADEFIPLIGKQAPDFTLTDIKGSKHKLSDYRGENVLLVFWATWCGPCKMTVPHLKELRKAVSEDKLAILAISHVSTYPPNTAEMIKQFAADNQINYPVLAVKDGDAGGPYDMVGSFPTVFFIDPEGKVKLPVTGLIRLDEFRAIIEAEWPKQAPL